MQKIVDLKQCIGWARQMRARCNSLWKSDLWTLPKFYSKISLFMKSVNFQCDLLTKMIRNNWVRVLTADFIHLCGFSSVDFFDRKLLQMFATANADVKLANASIHLCDLAFNVSVNKTVKFWLQ